eukprot:gene17444-22996_t
MSKNSGYFIGKTIGRLQGVRIQMEQQSKQNDVYKLHGSIRQGLQSARGIAYDLSNIVSPINNGASILAQKKAFDKKKSEDDAISASTNLSNLNKDVNINDEIKEEELHRLARLAIAEKEMAKMSGMNGNEIDQTENSTIAIVEKSQQNSGVPQGTLLKRSTIYRRDGSYITPDELIPEDRHTNYRKTLEKGPSDEWNKYRSKKNQNTIYIEAILGNSVNNKSREGFLKYGNQKLRFKCVWDNRDNLYGERSEYSMIYHLSDDTVEIFSSVSIASSMNSGREPFIRLLKRSKLPKVSVDELATGSLSFSAPVGVGNNDSNNNYYTWKDLNIGIEIIVYARTLHIIDADTPTREFYHSQGYELDPGVVIPEEVVNVKQREIPPYNGFGSEEDSLRSYNTLKVIEPPIRNSGFVGGTFLSRRQIKNTDNASFISENDLYIANQHYIG